MAQLFCLQRVLSGRFASRLRVITAPALAIAFAAACDVSDKSEPLPPATTIRDSAGIQIVESHRPSWKAGEEWTMAREPSVVIGKQDGPTEYLFDRIIGAVRLTNGRIVVADNGSQSLRIFDSSGVFLQSVGRAGSGPGEFASLTDVFRIRGDSLITHDHRNSLIIFDAAGKLAQQRNLSINAFYVLDIAGVHDDGTLVRKLGGEGRQLLSQAEHDSMVFQHIDRNGQVKSRFAFFAPPRPYVEFAGTPTIAQIMGVGPPPVLEKHYVLQTGRYVAVGPTMVYFGDSRRFEFLVATGSGTISRIMRVTTPLEKIPESVKTDSATYRIGRAAHKASEIIWPDFYPPFRQLMTDREGNLWAAMIPRSGESQDSLRYTVFDSSGVMLGEVSLPTKLSIFEIGSDYVLGLEKDALDVESVRHYALKKGPRQQR